MLPEAACVTVIVQPKVITTLHLHSQVMSLVGVACPQRSSPTRHTYQKRVIDVLRARLGS